MTVGDRLRRSGVGLRPEQTVRAAAEVMEAAGIGATVVVDGDVPVGIVTDRDLVRRVLARGVPDDARVDSVMTTPVVTVDAAEEVDRAFELIGRHGVRRLVVVDGGRFVGLVSLDDLLVRVSDELRHLGRTVAMEIHAPAHDAAPPARV
jgi:CBS domain-containing protein